MNSKTPSILVTGASGFIGSAVVQELSKRSLNVTCLSRNQVSHDNVAWEKASLDNDLEIEQHLSRNKPKFILHLAWEGIPDLSEERSRKNYEMGIRFIRKLFQAGAERLVISGSCLEYGEQSGEVSEADSPINASAFGRFKNELFQTALKEGKQESCKVINGRIFFAYGPGQRTGSLVPSLLNAIKAGEPISLRSPNAAQDFIEVSDVAAALVDLLLNEKAEEGIYNIGSGALTSVSEIAAAMSHKLGRDFATPVVTELKGMFANNEKLKKLGWFPKLSLEAGLERYILQHQFQGNS